jgi:hypothetical protein
MIRFTIFFLLHGSQSHGKSVDPGVHFRINGVSQLNREPLLAEVAQAEPLIFALFMHSSAPVDEFDASFGK